MAAQETYLIKFNADTGEFTQAVEKATDKVKELKVESSNTGQSGKFAFGLLDQATGGLAGKVKQSKGSEYRPQRNQGRDCCDGDWFAYRGRWGTHCELR